MVVASLLYAVCLYRAYGVLDTLSPYIYIMNSWGNIAAYIQYFAKITLHFTRKHSRMIHEHLQMVHEHSRIVHEHV